MILYMQQCSQNIFAYGFPQKGGDLNKGQNEELLKRAIHTDPSHHSDVHFLRKFPWNWEHWHAVLQLSYLTPSWNNDHSSKSKQGFVQHIVHFFFETK